MTTKQELNKPLEELTPEQLQYLLDNLDTFTDAELRSLDTPTEGIVEAKGRVAGKGEANNNYQNIHSNLQNK